MSGVETHQPRRSKGRIVAALDPREVAGDQGLVATVLAGVPNAVRIALTSHVIHVPDERSDSGARILDPSLVARRTRSLDLSWPSRRARSRRAARSLRSRPRKCASPRPEARWCPRSHGRRRVAPRRAPAPPARSQDRATVLLLDRAPGLRAASKWLAAASFIPRTMETSLRAYGGQGHLDRRAHRAAPSRRSRRSH